MRLASRQSEDGAFGLWSEGDGNASPWLGVYATEFLHRARKQGLYVPDDVIKRADKAIREVSRMPRYPRVQFDYGQGRTRVGDRDITTLKAEAAAYAHFVMAKNGQGDLSGLRYLYDNHKDKMKTPVAYAYLASALSMMGDGYRAPKAFSEGLTKAGYKDDGDYYQSALRDLAGYISAASEANKDDRAAEAVENFKNELLDADYLNTQDKAYVILALRGLMKNTASISVRARNAELEGSDKRPSAHLYGTDLGNQPTFTNTSDAPVWASVTVSGSTEVAPEPISEGFVLAKDIFTMSGQKMTPRSVKQGERFVVRVTFSSTANMSRTAVLADLLPAGWEIETVLRAEDGARKDGSTGAYKWVGNISDFDITEARDDRFIASNRTYRKDEYIAAYIVRAVTPGSFALPGAVVEDMYRPVDRAITDARTIEITADPTL